VLTVYSCYPITKPIRSTEPAFEAEPLTVEDAKRQCGVADGNDYRDADFRRWIVSARRQVEHDAEIVFYTGTFTWKLSRFPVADWLEIPLVRPVSSITSITYPDNAGATQTWSSSEYTLKEAMSPVIELNYGFTWPAIREVVNGITVTLVAGHATVFAMPQQYIDAVILKVRSHYLTSLGEDTKGDEMAYESMIGLVGRWAAA